MLIFLMRLDIRRDKKRRELSGIKYVSESFKSSIAISSIFISYFRRTYLLLSALDDLWSVRG